jgi:hypothetical protein
MIYGLVCPSMSKFTYLFIFPADIAVYLCRCPQICKVTRQGFSGGSWPEGVNIVVD